MFSFYKVSLPPLVVNGEAKIFRTMNLKELQQCLRGAIKACGSAIGNSAGPLPWWPNKQIPWHSDFYKDMTTNEKILVHRHLLTACYSHYKQLDVLHLFDTDPASRSKWTLLHKSDGYHLVTLPSLKTIEFYSHHEVPKILPLIALAAQQKALRVSKSGRSTKSTANKAESSKSPTTRANGRLKANIENGLEALQSFVKQLDLRAVESSSRRSSISIFGTWSPRRMSTVDQPSTSTSKLLLRPCYSLKCPTCPNFRCSANHELLRHMTMCFKKSTIRQKQKKVQFLRHLNLVECKVYNAYRSVIEKIPKPTKLAGRLSTQDVKFLTKSFPLSVMFDEPQQSMTIAKKRRLVEKNSDKNDSNHTYPLNGIINNNVTSSFLENNVKSCSFFNMEMNNAKILKSRSGSNVSKLNGFYPVVYNEKNLNSYCDDNDDKPYFHKYSFNSGKKRRQRAEELRNDGLGVKGQLLLKKCKKLTVAVKRLSKDDNFVQKSPKSPKSPQNEIFAVKKPLKGLAAKNHMLKLQIKQQCKDNIALKMHPITADPVNLQKLKLMKREYSTNQNDRRTRTMSERAIKKCQCCKADGNDRDRKNSHDFHNELFVDLSASKISLKSAIGQLSPKLTAPKSAELSFPEKTSKKDTFNPENRRSSNSTKLKMLWSPEKLNVFKSRVRKGKFSANSENLLATGNGRKSSGSSADCKENPNLLYKLTFDPKKVKDDGEKSLSQNDKEMKKVKRGRPRRLS